MFLCYVILTFLKELMLIRQDSDICHFWYFQPNACNRCHDLTLIWVGEQFYRPSQFCHNKSKMVKAVTLELCSFQWDSIRDICAKFGIHNSPQSPDIGQNSDRGISDFQISGQSVIKENCHNSRTSDDVDMELGSETKLDKRNKTTSKKLTLTSCRKIVTSLSFSDFWPIWSSLEARFRTQCLQVIFSVIVPFCLTKTKNRTEKSLTKLSHYCFE